MEKFEKKAIGSGFIWFVITPANYDYSKAFFNLKMDKNEFSNILKERINFLKENKENIQLHIHLGFNKSCLDIESQKLKFKESMEFIKSLNIKPKKFAAGWWIYNKDTISLVKKYGFEEIYDYNINPLLRFIKINGIKIKYIYKYKHDFDFI